MTALIASSVPIAGRPLLLLSRHFGLTVALAATMFLTVHAADAQSECAEGHIIVTGTLADRWDKPISQLCEELGTMKDVDPSARLRVTASGKDLLLEASLSGGRVAHRVVRSPDELRTIVEALTVRIPEMQRDEAAASVPLHLDNPPPSTAAPRTAAAAAPPGPTPAPHADRLGVELGFALEGRLSGSPAYLSLGGVGYAALRPGDWFFGLVARWQPSEVPASAPQKGFEMESAGAGFVVARRVLKARNIGLDAGASALVLVDTQSTETRVPDEVGSSTDVRFGVLLRALIGKGPWKFAPSIDADLAPVRLRRNVQLDPELPPLPAWSVALAIGASWGES